MSTYQLTVSGPNARLAMLRALLLKAADGVRDWFSGLRIDLGTSVHRLRHLTTGILGAVSSPAVYSIAVSIVCKAASASYKLTKAALRWFGRTAQRGLDLVTTAVSAVNPTAGAVFADLTYKGLTLPVQRAFNATDNLITTAGRTIAAAMTADLVQAVTTRAAQVATMLLGINVLTRGALAARVVSLVPATMSVVVWLTDPVRLALAVALLFIGAVGYAIVRPEPKRADWDMGAIASSVQVEVLGDGTIRVSGIPSTLPVEIGERVAAIAADAAVKRLERIHRLRPELTRDDRRVLVKCAREAVRALLPISD